MRSAQVKSDEDELAGESTDDEADLVFISEEDNDDVWGDAEVIEGFRDALRELKLCLEGKAQDAADRELVC